MKKLTALLLACMMLLGMTSAMAASVYTNVTPADTSLAVTHALTLTREDATGLDFDINYSFAVDGVEVVQPTGLTNASLAVEGAPTIADVTYGPSDTFTNRKCTKTLEIDWSDVEIKQPGVYRWKVTKTWTDSDTLDDPTNNSATTYLYVYAYDNAGTLTIGAVGMTADAALATKDKDLEDSYPAQSLDLSISKTVTGTQGSKDQYFKVTVTLTSPAGTAADKTYQISGVDVAVPETAYHGATTNVTQITVPKNSSASVELWLKHGQTAIISDLLSGTAYTIVESENDGYEVTSTVIGDTTEATADGETVSDTSMQISSTVTYTNKKDATVPTGVTLQTAAPVAGMMLALAMLALLFVGKRKENMA